MFFKKNKGLIIVSIITISIVLLSFYQYFEHRFGYLEGYKVIKENCHHGKNPNHEYCRIVPTEEIFEKYLDNNDPKKLYASIDAISLTFSIVEYELFSSMQMMSPLIIIVGVVITIHSQLSSGMFKNYLLRMSYKDYLKKIYKNVMKLALIMPIALILIFIISLLITNFNFNIGAAIEKASGYNKWKYTNFFLYGAIICLIQFFISLVYVNIGLYFCKKNKNKLVTIVMGYIMFIIVNFLIYGLFYTVVINKILGFKNISDYFNIAGYWFFNDSPKSWIALIMAIIIQGVSFIPIYRSYKKKEQVVQESEAQMA